VTRKEELKPVFQQALAADEFVVVDVKLDSRVGCAYLVATNPKLADVELSDTLRFEWNPRKAKANRAKHGVSFEEAVTVFADPIGRITDDPRHSETEERYVLLGQSARRRLVAVMFTERGQAIRLFSARKATRRERREYEEK